MTTGCRQPPPAAATATRSHTVNEAHHTFGDMTGADDRGPCPSALRPTRTVCAVVGLAPGLSRRARPGQSRAPSAQRQNWPCSVLAPRRPQVGKCVVGSTLGPHFCVVPAQHHAAAFAVLATPCRVLLTGV
eukprot:CAMPEP_0174369034 /NCGR_PEP_ID=MMETSP0811_2-20130205/91089_1 /TAXON_ID=73025 ORGANISM="Eutreptiella gymnastica-like, Strain CCMP1594" /NCGR_SAMPLE_ID=MMETSP0811_2 /ASSEMBLY_ACC=CAM_ASM_000667 /LENGTH=130 /DNA_ID=CAMNT_0015513075 /DNA_START=377 /DNA_END=769 /DNA_ORIENTATION=-